MDIGDRMRYFVSFLIAFSNVCILLMPAWISWIPRGSWPLPLKRIVVILMSLVSIAYAVIVITKPNLHLPTKIIGSIVTIVYLLLVFIALYYSWPKLR